jgi:hypothetical protein
LHLETEYAGHETRSAVVGDENANCSRPSGGLEIAGAVERMKARIAQLRGVPDVVKPGSGHQERCGLRVNCESEELGAAGDRPAVCEPTGIGMEYVASQIRCTGDDPERLKPFVERRAFSAWR